MFRHVLQAVSKIWKKHDLKKKENVITEKSMILTLIMDFLSLVRHDFFLIIHAWHLWKY